ncbi:molecular chaperone DnaK [Algoriphagus namhaensis]|uniref:Molecular chaperone DnaK n=1 Tax=Algoriphagus namhaensis TaxID=915353 RepID=A0ABV8APD0_9BACT
MKISKADFESMKAKYDAEVKKGKPAKGNNGREKDDQTDWIFFDRETLESLLAEADKDPKVGGIQFYFTEYTKETAQKYYPKNPDKYEGQLNLVLKAGNLREGVVEATDTDDGGDYQNRGKVCPPDCNPEP